MKARNTALGLAWLCASFVTTTAAVAAQAGAPAGFNSPAPGTTLDYGRWTCQVQKGAEFETVCASGEQRIRLFGGLFPHGRLDRSGFGGMVGRVNCIDVNINASTDVYSLGNAQIDEDDKRAIKGLWPLKVGKRVRFSMDMSGQDGSIDTTVKVVRQSTMTIAGRARKVFELRGESSMMTDCGGSITQFERTWLFDPESGLVVRYELTGGQGLLPGHTAFELAAVRYPKPSSKGVLMVQRPPPAPSVNQPEKKLVAARPARPPARSDKVPPVLSIPPSLVAEGAVIEIAGRVKDDSKIVEVTVAGRRLTPNADGHFSVRRGVLPGNSVIEISAMDEWGNVARRSIAVTRMASRVVSTPHAASTRPRKTEELSGIDFGRYHALVVGNNGYRYLPRLDSAIADADEVSRVLESEYGFQVTQLRDATRSNVLGALAKYRATLGPQDNLLIYYAGHGILDKETQTGYWLPTDAEAANPANWISTSDITTMLRALRSKHVMIVADSCYSGTLVRTAAARLKTTRARKVWIKRMVSKRARTALVSGGLEPVVDGGGGRHSVFAKAFLDALRENEGVLEGQTLFERIKRPVILNADQTPQYSDIRLAGHEGGDFMFVRR